MAVAATGASVSQPALADSPGPLESQSFQVGTQGALCQAESVRLGDARDSIFDRKWVLICSDVDRPVGAAYSWRGNPEIQDKMSETRGLKLECSAAGSAAGTVTGALLRRCRDMTTGLEWNSYSVASGKWIHVVEGLVAFDSALRLTLASLAEDRIVPGEVSIVTTSSSGSLAEALANVGNSDLLIGQGYRRNNAGEYVAAEEYFRPNLVPSTDDEARNAAEVQAQRHELLVNRALQLSNLGRFSEATRVFGEAEALGLRDPIQARLLRNFQAIDALNKGNLAEVTTILARPVPALASPADASDGSVAIDKTIAASLNAGLASGLTNSVSQETRLTTVERSTILDAQARQLAGTALRLNGQPEQALAELTAARNQILAVKEGRVLSAARLQAQIMSEMALANETLGRNAPAEQLLRDALALIELRYPESASVNGARARLAAFLTREGKRDGAMEIYRSVVESTMGQRSALVGVEHQMSPYFNMLVEDLPAHPELISDLFIAAQLVERPGAAQTLSQLTRRLEGGSSEASDLFRREVNVERELNLVNAEYARLQAGDRDAAGAELADLEDQRARLAQSQLELISALSQYPAYRSLAHNYVTADELRGLLQPGEAYLKLVKLDDEMFAIYISPGKSTGWRLDANPTKIAEQVAKLRDSISLTIGGVNATYPFDVDSSRTLYQDLFGPVSAEVAGLKHLVFEPDGALLQLPINLLIADQAGVDDYHRRVENGGDEFDFRGLAWVGRDKAISTALSPSSFRDARKAPPSKAGRAYLGLGQNAPVGRVTPASYVRGAPNSVEAGCEIPLATWNSPISASELQLASQVLGADRSELITGAAFTDTALEHDSDLDQYRIVHFATHGLVTAPRSSCPARPALVTSFGGPESDGLLGFVEIFDLKLDADLVILSACNTASLASLQVTREAGIEGGGGQALDGLVRAFIGAGGRQVIASHWPAPDAYGATRRLFKTFFESPAGTSVGDALLAAQRKLMDDADTSHPFYWSGFALIGDGERPLLPAS